MDGGGGTTCKPPPGNEPQRPPPPKFPAPWMADGGDTTVMPAFPRLACAILEIARCPRMGNTGAGATTSERPMLISPTPRIGPCTIGGGATTEAVGPAIACRAETASTAGGGATMESSGRPSRRDVVWLTAGGW